MPVLMTKNANSSLKRMNDYQKQLDQTVRDMKAEGDRGKTWIDALKEAGQVLAACGVPLEAIMAINNKSDLQAKDLKNLQGYLRLLTSQWKSVSLRALTKYKDEHGAGGAKAGGANFLSKALKSEKDKAAEQKRVSWCAKVEMLRNVQWRELQNLNPDNGDSLAKWVGLA